MAIKTVVHKYSDGRHRVTVELPPCDGIRRTNKELYIVVDPEFGINVGATGDLGAAEISAFTEALTLAQRLMDGTLVIDD